MKLSQSLRSNSLIYLVDEVVRIRSRISTLFAGVQHATGLKNMENAVLMAVLEANTAPTVPQIGRSLGHPRQVIQRAVDALEAIGYIEKHPNPDHKRVPLLVATEKGFAYKEITDKQALAVAEDFLKGFDSAKCQQIGDDLHQLRQALEAFSRGKKKPD